MVTASSTSQLHPSSVLDNVTETTEFVGGGGQVEEEGEDGRLSLDGRDQRLSLDGRSRRLSPDGRSRLVGGREEGAMREMVVDSIRFKNGRSTVVH